MTTEELEELLEAATETQSIEFKQSCQWSVPCFAKDILAMSNVRNGGWIIVGMEEGSDSTYNRTGVNPDHRASFIIDDMRDQMTVFADPHVSLLVDFPKDKNGTEYVAIRVLTFEEIPVICRKDSLHTKAGTVYYRNRNRRAESAPISNSYDMREIITLAASRLKQRLSELGFRADDSLERRLDEELQGL